VIIDVCFLPNAIQGTEQLPYYTYNLVGSNWSATFVVVDSDCFLSSYQKVLFPCSNYHGCTDKYSQNTSVYRNTYTSTCHNDTQTQVDFLSTTFDASNEIVIKHQGVVINGHDHCLGHFYQNNTNFILSGAAGYPQAGDCNNGTALGPYALYLGANNLTGKSE
jgi:tartrate-resistant acid phosphatase type 5